MDFCTEIYGIYVTLRKEKQIQYLQNYIYIYIIIWTIC